MTSSNKEGRSGCYWAALIVLVLILLVSVAANIGLLFGLALQVDPERVRKDRAVDEYPEFLKRWSYGEGDVLAVRIPLSGIIVRDGAAGLFPRPDKVEQTLRQIRAATNNRDIRAIILELDSPGGAVTPCDEIYHALTRFRESRDDRRVLVFTRDINASGAYYLSMAGDWIMAEPTALLGSIGVLIQSLNWQGLSERIGIRDTTIKSGEQKDLLNPFRDVTDEERAILQDLVDTMFARFAGIVQEGRGFTDEQMERISDGRIMTADRALETGMIDEIGYWDDVVVRTADLLEEETIKIIRYYRRPDFFERFMQMNHPLDLRSWLDADTPRVMYLWRP